MLRRIRNTIPMAQGCFFKKNINCYLRIFLFVWQEGELMYTHSSYNYTMHNSSGAEYDSKSDGIGLNITPGIAYSLSRCIQLEASLQNLLSFGYSSTKENAKDANQQDYKSNSVYINSSLDPISLSGISLGIRFFINK